ncbi:MAG: nitrate/nitrite transporter NrtS [Novosphingobium sp.]|nr:nitrate/nitrite transporter NrtS [Novosphingobium sp.]
MSGGGSALQAVFRPPILTRSLIVALVVGTVLNLINQGDVLWDGARPDWAKLMLTYCVPFCVASYGAWSALRAVERDTCPNAPD